MSQDNIYDKTYVKDLFDKCSRRYIAFSYICSFGFTERWRKQCVRFLGKVPAAAKGYDLMAGTGEVWRHLLRANSEIHSITAIDISSGMHTLAMERLHKMRANKIQFFEDDVLSSRLPANSADFIVSTFGLKTFSPAQHKDLAKLVAFSLKTGGQFSFIEASDPKGWIFRPIYLFHLRVILPEIERLFLKGAQDFTMINIYMQRFQNASGFADALSAEGLTVTYRKVMFGCATSVYGYK